MAKPLGLFDLLFLLFSAHVLSFLNILKFLYPKKSPYVFLIIYGRSCL
jgi:hypothetical protein